LILFVLHFFYCWFIQLNIEIYGILNMDILHETTDYSGVIKNHQEILKKYPNEMIKRKKKKKKCFIFAAQIVNSILNFG